MTRARLNRLFDLAAVIPDGAPLPAQAKQLREYDCPWSFSPIRRAFVGWFVGWLRRQTKKPSLIKGSAL